MSSTYLLIFSMLLTIPQVVSANTNLSGLELGSFESTDDLTDLPLLLGIELEQPTSAKPKALPEKAIVPKLKIQTESNSSPSVSPARYLDFSSPSPASATKIQSLVNKYGKNILIGADPGDSFTSGSFAQTMKAAKAAGAKVHIYLEGPGGVTGSSGIAPDELARMKAGAQKASINTNSSNWKSEWNQHGWKTHTRSQLVELQKLYGPGFSYEIDNLYNAKVEGPSSVVKFFKEQEKWQKENNIKATLMMKNLTPEELNAVAGAVNKGEISRSFFSDFHISESGTGNRAQQEAAAAKMGIQSVPSNNTYQYDARGEFKADGYFKKSASQLARNS